MESNMVGNSNNDIVKNYFKQNLSKYVVFSETSQGPYWGVKLVHNGIEINVSGDIAFSIEITIHGSKFDLWQYDRSVNNAMETNDKNIIYQLDVLRKFLKPESEPLQQN
jgi:6-phosphogluconate dehydrogenase (decarboxylating)